MLACGEKRPSPSSRRAWIEIQVNVKAVKDLEVALLAEGVDRNRLCRNSYRTENRSPSSRRAWIEMSSLSASTWIRSVALLAEGVDRNPAGFGECVPTLVALLAEGVDRNTCPCCDFEARGVALLAEGVDRNQQMRRILSRPAASPSSRRAWIEIFTPCSIPTVTKVALLAEGVDRNSPPSTSLGTVMGRPPRGGRG